MEEAAQDFARQHPDVVLYVSPRSGPGPAPVLRAEYCECCGVWGGDGGLPALPRPCTISARCRWCWGSCCGVGEQQLPPGGCRMGGSRPDPLILLQ